MRSRCCYMQWDHLYQTTESNICFICQLSCSQSAIQPSKWSGPCPSIGGLCSQPCVTWIWAELTSHKHWCITLTLRSCPSHPQSRMSTAVVGRRGKHSITSCHQSWVGTADAHPDIKCCINVHWGGCTYSLPVYGELTLQASMLTVAFQVDSVCGLQPPCPSTVCPAVTNTASCHCECRDS